MLLERDALRIPVEKLFPLGAMVTPNMDEAALLHHPKLGACKNMVYRRNAEHRVQAVLYARRGFRAAQV